MDEKVGPRNLRVVIAVYEEGSVAGAARRLLRAPSAVARTVKEIESALSVPLFERGSGGMAPSIYGQTVYQRARLVAAEFDAARKLCIEAGAHASAPLLSMMVSIRQLTAIVRLRELGRVGSAGETLGISQPAVSAALGHIEQVLGSPLFRRTARAMVTTEFGEHFIFRLRRVLSEIERLKVDLSQLRGELAGRVTLAALPSSKGSLLPRAICRLVARHPQAQISVIDAPYQELFAAVQSGEIDFILTSITPEYRRKELRIHALGRERMAVVARAGHPLAGRQGLDVRELAAFPWVLRDPSAPSRRFLDSVFKRIGLHDPRIAVQCADLGLLRGLLAQSDMLSAVSPQHLQHELRDGLLALLDVELPQSEREIGFVLREDIQPSALCLMLMDEIRIVLAEERGALGGDERHLPA
ncbi:MAG: LysR family transcriptional regulator [Pseudomonadales bacterium]